ncbi:MAG TPA: phytanoyl-CoA dioxygenase family protein [Chloroflexota bacterium]|nr:phytanoyl-CoA dioxygenase family protein [Chloroflexota bacterium]
MAGLTQRQKDQFDHEGYLLAEDLFDPSEYLDPMIEEYEELLDRLANELYAEGKLASTYSDLPFGKRLTKIYAETGTVHAGYFDFSLPFKDVKPDQPCHFGPAVFNILRNPGILDVAESLIGGEIYSNPVQHVRMKPPERFVPRDPKTGRVMLGATQWHQDASVIIEEADETEMLTVWVPIWNATEENGCLCVVPRNHEAGLFQHCVSAERGNYLPDQFFDVDRSIPVPVRRGGALFLHRKTPHSSLSNNSDDVRWSMDLRYNPTGQPTGRPEFPGFVARSRANPESELRDPVVWKERWLETRARMSAHPELVGAFNRWKVGAPGCA